MSGENTSVGGVINLDYTKGENQATVSNVIDLQGVMEAYTHFTAHTVSDANLNAQSHKQGSGFVAVNRISASNRLNRNVSINVLDGTEITANFGNLDILAEAGRGDNITTRVTIDSNGVVATAKIQIDVTVNSEVTLNMSQVKLQNRFGTVNIKADSSADNVDSVGSTDASGLGTAPNASVNNNVTLTAKVVIEGKAGTPATIEGTIVNIVSYIGTLYVNGHAYSKGSSLGADVDATSNQTISLTAQTAVDYADVTAHDRADIYASVKPEYRSSNIRYYAAVQLNAVGHGKAKSAGAVTRSAETIIGSGFIYRGAQLTGDSTLRLAAVGDIGTLDHVAFIDVPCKVIVDRVNSFYADFNLRDFETYEQLQQIKEYAITQGYLVSQAEAMAEKLLTVLEQDYLDNSDLRFYNIVLDESTILAIRTVLGREEEEEPLTADDLIQGFAQLDSQTRQDILTALFRTALADGQGLDEVEDGLRTRNQELKQLAQRKQQILEQLETNLSAQHLEQLRQEYIQAEAREQTLRQEIRDLNDRKADIQDGYRDYVEDDSDMEALLAQANSLNPQDENFLEQAWSLLDRLTSKDAFNDQSLTSGRLAAQAIFQAAQTAAKAVQSQAAALLDQVFTTKSQQQAQALVQLKALTEQIADLEALSDRAYTAGQTLNNTHVDVPARSSEVLIGEIQGELYLTNEGSISVTVDSGHKPVSRFEPNLDHIRIGDHDVLLGEIYSHRGDVTIENVTAGIAAKTLDPGHANITAHEITLKAHGSIGSEGQSVITEQRDVVPSKVVSVVEEIYQGQLADRTVSGDSLPGKGAIGIQTGQRYESLDGTLELVEVTLLLADGSKLTAPIRLEDLREITRQANTTGGNVYNFLTDSEGTAAALQIVTRYDWVRYLDPMAGTRTDAESQTGSIYLKENSGTLNIGQIRAAENISLEAPDGVYSVLTEDEQDKQNIGDVNVGSTDASHFSGAGDNISVNVDGSVEVGDILADREDGRVDITAGGDVKQEQDTAIHGDSLNIDAGGDVDVNVHVNEIDVDAGGSVDITSGKPTLVVDGIHAGEDVNIDAEGSVVSDGGDGIHAGGDVNIDAGGNIGSLDEDLVIDAGGDVTWDSEYGLGFIRIVTDEVKDSQGPDKIWDDPDARSYAVRKADGTLETYLRPGTGLEVFGRNLKNTFLWVGTESLRKEIFGHAENTMHLMVTAAGEVLFDYWMAIDRIVGYLAENGTYIPVIEPDDSGSYLRQSLTFRLYVGSQYDGWTFTVDTGRYQVRGEVEDGYLCFTLPAGQASIQVELTLPVL